MGKIEKKRNVLKIINDATYVLGDCWGQMICATALAMVSILAWILFAPFGLVLMVFRDGIKIVVVTLVVRKAGTKSGELHLETL